MKLIDWTISQRPFRKEVTSLLNVTSSSVELKILTGKLRRRVFSPSLFFRAFSQNPYSISRRSQNQEANILSKGRRGGKRGE